MDCSSLILQVFLDAIDLRPINVLGSRPFDVKFVVERRKLSGKHYFYFVKGSFDRWVIHLVIRLVI